MKILQSDVFFSNNVSKELDLLSSGYRGIVRRVRRGAGSEALTIKFLDAMKLQMISDPIVGEITTSTLAYIADWTI